MFISAVKSPFFFFSCPEIVYPTWLVCLSACPEHELKNGVWIQDRRPDSWEITVAFTPRPKEDKEGEDTVGSTAQS